MDLTALPNRLVMAPMTRLRADAHARPTPLMAEYYAQRASAGLIVTESTAPSPDALAGPGAPGLWTRDQQARWAAVAAAVHHRGGRIALQLSDVGPARPGVAGEHARAARRAIAAGFDAVEVHTGNAGLLDRTLVADGPRLTGEVVAAVCAAIGPERVGVRTSPGGTYGGMDDPRWPETHARLLDALAPLRPAWLHVIEAPDGGGAVAQARAALPPTTRLIANGPMGLAHDDLAGRLTWLHDGTADLVSFGRAFLANPDLPERLRAALPLDAPDEATFYAGGARGYTDYPSRTCFATDGTSPSAARRLTNSR